MPYGYSPERAAQCDDYWRDENKRGQRGRLEHVASDIRVLASHHDIPELRRIADEVDNIRRCL